MTDGRLVLVGVAGFVAVVVLGLVAGEIGGVAIRSASRTHAVAQLGVATPVLVPGLPVCLAVPRVAAEGTVLVMRGETGTVPVPTVTEGDMCAGFVVARVPCAEPPADGAQVVRLHLLGAQRGALLAQSRQLTLLAPGPDCVLESRQ